MTNTVAAPQGLPDDDGQVWRAYDIRPYTDRMTNVDRPQKAIVDWILRETGTETWFYGPAGTLNADRHNIRVYHTPAVQRLVADVVNRFVQSDANTYVFGARLVTLRSPNWRIWALQRLRPVNVSSPGIQAWLLSREDAAMLESKLSKRADYRELNSPNLLIGNGQTHDIACTYPLNYLRSASASNGTTTSMRQTPQTGQVHQGFTMRLSPLLSSDGRLVDAVMKVEANRVEKLDEVWIESPNSVDGNIAIQVPQMSGWRLHERFRWPVDEVLMVSCGVVAAPGPIGAPRVEALLLLEARGKSAPALAVPGREPRTSGREYRGRY